MDTVTDLSELAARVVFDRAEIDRLRLFQINRYFESGILVELPKMLAPDPSIELSTYFGLYNHDDEIQATARIVRAAAGLPMLEHHPIFPDMLGRLQAAKNSVAEISRLAVGTDTPHYRALALLSREFLRFGLQNQHATVLVAAVEKPLVRILNHLLGVPLHVIGPSIHYSGDYRGECVPILIDTVECLNNFRLHKSRRWEFFMDGLVIDLTDAQLATRNTANPLERFAF